MPICLVVFGVKEDVRDTNSKLKYSYLAKRYNGFECLYLMMVTPTIPFSMFGNIHSTYDLAYLMEEVRITYSRDVKLSVADMQLDSRGGDIASVPRWVANVLSQNNLVEIHDSETSSYVSRALNRERIAKPHDLSTLDPDFYVRVNDYLKSLKERERENLMISINSFVTARLEKIVKLAAASPLSPEMSEKLSAEEKYLYDLVHNSTDTFKRKVIKRFD